MTDKFRRTHPLNITFSDGEAPTGNKLTAVASQARVGARLLEKAVGDVWNQSGDLFTNDFPLQIPNIARIIGELRLLSPVLYRLDQNFTYVDKVGDKFPTRTEGFLQFAPVAGTVAAGAGSANLTSLKSSESDLAAAGDWYVDTTTGRWKTVSVLNATDSITYTVNDSEWPVDGYHGPCVIPDPRQSSFTACRVSQSGSSFFLHLPPRRPLTFDDSSPGSYDLARPDRYPSSADVASNEATSTSAPYRLWQGATSALADAHYRYRLPQELVDYLATASVGTAIPDGYLYLWDQDSQTVVEDVVFTKSSQGAWVFEISSATANFTSKASSTEGEASYSSTKYSIICPGSSLTRAIFNLQKCLYTASGSNKGDFSAIVSHSVLNEANPPPSSFAAHGSRYPSYAPSWVGSRWAHDDHMYLMSRLGSQTNLSWKRDRYNGAMLGHLILGNADTSGAGNFLDGDIPNESFKLYFGDTDGVRLHARANHIVELDNTGGTTISFDIGVDHGGRLGVGAGNPGGRTVYIRSLFNNMGIDVRSAGTGTGILVTCEGTISANGAQITGALDGDGIQCTSGNGINNAAIRATPGASNGLAGVFNGSIQIDTSANTAGAGIEIIPNAAGDDGIWIHDISPFGTGIFVESEGLGNDIGVEIGDFALGLKVLVTNAGAEGASITSLAGRALVVTGDTSSPVFAAFKLVPQSAQPTGASQIGDMYVTTAGVLKICTVAGTPGTWVSVGAQT